MTEYAPDSPFIYDPSDIPDTTTEVAQTVPGAMINGPIESMKRALIVALRDALTGSSLTLNNASIKVSMEYPMTKAKNPGIWVQFSYTNLDRAGIDHEVYVKRDGVWTAVQEWLFYGRTSLTIVAYTAIERDRISDAFIANIAFARTPDRVLTKVGEDTKQFRGLIAAINDNPYVHLTINTDSLQPGGPGMSVGTPWNDNQFVYEDTYSFECVGQFNVAFAHDGTYELAAVDVEPTAVEDAEEGWTPWV